ncbi:TPA: hypothetical protein SLG40_001626 [Serratia odorifera]|nr:hypothetical protein [Serratia odorifera]
MTHTLTTDELRQIVETDHVQCGDAAAMARELLANREAQPVGFYTTVSGRKGVIWHNGAPEDDTAIYTAPPAPAVPGAISTRQAIVKMESHEPCGSINVAYKLGWNACRAAMPGQPVTLAYKLNSPEIPDGWALVPVELTVEMQAAWDGAPNCSDDDTVNMMNAYRAMLAATPEVND